MGMGSVPFILSNLCGHPTEDTDAIYCKIAVVTSNKTSSSSIQIKSYRVSWSCSAIVHSIRLLVEVKSSYFNNIN